MIYFNLAPFRYNEILSIKNSPIEKIDVIEFKNSVGDYFEVHGWLKSKYKYDSTEKSDLYGSCDATGSDKHLQIATWKCISELIERWAFHELLKRETTEYGMGLDKTSTGFAALSCWPRSAVRAVAYGEAIERWAISNWWREKIAAYEEVKPVEDGRTGVVAIDVDRSVGRVVIVYKQAEGANGKFYCYGFAHGKNLKSAIGKASVEMLRNERVLQGDCGQEISSINDKRLMYFATEEGFLHFKSKTKPAATRSGIVPPDLIVDCEIPGDWSRYATVWRCLLPDTVYNWADPKHFMF